MIKTLLNADEEPPPGIEVVTEETLVTSPPEMPNTEPLSTEETSERFETRQVFEIPEDAKFFAKPAGETDEILQIPGVSETNAEPLVETVKDETVNFETPDFETADPASSEEVSAEKIKDETSPTIFQSTYQPESSAETVRQSGLAYSAAIVFFGSVVFMLVIGWFADLLLGSSPWGIVGGIVLGGIIGFVQFFRITSQIFKK